MFKTYFWNIVIAFDQLVNAFLGGDPDETISSRMGKFLRTGVKTWKYYLSYAICRLLHPIDKDHCKKAIEDDEGSRSIFK